MPAPRRGCLDYSKVYYDVRQRWFLAWKQNQHITYYIFHIQDTNSEISIAHLYICPYFVWWHRLNHCVALTRADFHFGPCLGKLAFNTHTSTILAPLWCTNLESWRFRNLSISTLSCRLCLAGLHSMVEAVEQHRRFSVAVWKKGHL